VPTYRDEAVVLRTHRLGEADRIITLLTREHGKIRAVAKGVRRTKSRFGARLEPFFHVDIQCHMGRALDTVTEVSVLHAYGSVLAAHWPAWSAGSAMLETADKLTSEDREPQPAQFRLLVAALNSLSKAEHDSGLILDAYFIRACSLAGYAPALTACVVCDGDVDAAFFHVQSGGVMCSGCKAPGSTAVSTSVVELMSALLAGQWDVADASAQADRRVASALIGAHVQHNLERGLRSLPHVDRAEAQHPSSVDEPDADSPIQQESA
jgi:DNA repair protein RecO (recombination protein O)